MLKTLAVILLSFQVSFGAELDLLGFLAKVQNDFSQSGAQDEIIADHLDVFNKTTMASTAKILPLNFNFLDNGLLANAKQINKVINFLKKNQTKTMKIDSYIPGQLYNQVEDGLLALYETINHMVQSLQVYVNIYLDNGNAFQENAQGKLVLPVGVGLQLIDIKLKLKKQTLHLQAECNNLQQVLTQISNQLLAGGNPQAAVFFNIAANAFKNSATEYGKMASDIGSLITGFKNLDLQNSKTKAVVSASTFLQLLNKELTGIGKQYNLKASQMNKAADLLPSSSSSSSSVVVVKLTVPPTTTPKTTSTMMESQFANSALLLKSQNLASGMFNLSNL